MEALNDLDELPGMAMPGGPNSVTLSASASAAQHLGHAAAGRVDTPPDSPAKRLKRGFEQLELEDTAARSDAVALSVVGAAGGSTSEHEPLEPGFLDSRRTLSSNPVSRVAIVGGTHGNERNGVALAQHFIDCPQHIARPSFEAVAIIGNPVAVQANQRYVEVDMNRCFEAHVLEVRRGQIKSSKPSLSYGRDLNNLRCCRIWSTTTRLSTSARASLTSSLGQSGAPSRTQISSSTSTTPLRKLE